jgi:hypothetical protein
MLKSMFFAARRAPCDMPGVGEVHPAGGQVPEKGIDFSWQVCGDGACICELFPSRILFNLLKNPLWQIILPTGTSRSIIGAGSLSNVAFLRPGKYRRF